MTWNRFFVCLNIQAIRHDIGLNFRKNTSKYSVLKYNKKIKEYVKINYIQE